MSIDPVTFVAQLINLAILIFLLQKLLYKPLLNAVDTREATISKQVQGARDTMAEAERRLAQIAASEREMEAKRSIYLNNAYLEAEKLRDRLEKDARKEMAGKRALWIDELEAERKGIERDLRAMIVGNFTAFSKKALKDLANDDLENRSLAVLKDKFDSLPDEDKNKLKGGKTVEILTARPLSEKTKENLISFVADKFGAARENILFKEKSSLLCGVEIISNGNVLSWNLDAYLNEFSHQMDDALNSLSVRVKNKEN